jgi:hypothetical protein
MAKLKMINNSAEKMTMEEAEEKLRQAEIKAEKKKDEFYESLYNRAKKVIKYNINSVYIEKEIKESNKLKKIRIRREN